MGGRKLSSKLAAEASDITLVRKVGNKMKYSQCRHGNTNSIFVHATKVNNERPMDLDAQLMLLSYVLNARLLYFVVDLLGEIR